MRQATLTTKDNFFFFKLLSLLAFIALALFIEGCGGKKGDSQPLPDTGDEDTGKQDEPEDAGEEDAGMKRRCPYNMELIKGDIPCECEGEIFDSLPEDGGSCWCNPKKGIACRSPDTDAGDEDIGGDEDTGVEEKCDIDYRAGAGKTYAPDWEAIKEHPMPDWFRDAKFGVMIHWGLSAIPAWAELTGEFETVVNEKGWEYWFKHNPYAEWYPNTIRIEGSPAKEYHEKTYGANFPYEDFAPMFNDKSKKWDPEEWADLIKKSGAKYAVPITKHHDGFTLWNTSVKNPNKQNWKAERDIIGEFAEALGKKCVRLGIYYSGGIDWTFENRVITDLDSLVQSIPTSPEYSAYALQHWKELIDLYKPFALWNDIGYPNKDDLKELFAHYYNTVPEGVINDRFDFIRGVHHDYETHEYAATLELTDRKWESVRGFGFGFGYNQLETEEHYISLDDLVDMLVDIVSKNGNLLLNIGPMDDGTVPEGQKNRLLGLGQWLRVNGDAIYETRPWVVAEGEVDDGLRVRYTQKGHALYAILLDEPSSDTVRLKGLKAVEGSAIRLLGFVELLKWYQEGDDMIVTLPKNFQPSQAHSFKIVPMPERVETE